MRKELDLNPLEGEIVGGVDGVLRHIDEMREYDSEIAHMSEDQLHHAVLRAIATGQADDPKALAAAALQTLRLNFDRWYA